MTTEERNAVAKAWTGFLDFLIETAIKQITAERLVENVKYQDTGDKTALLSESGEPNDKKRKRSAVQQ